MGMAAVIAGETSAVTAVLTPVKSIVAVAKELTAVTAIAAKDRATAMILFMIQTPFCRVVTPLGSALLRRLLRNHAFEKQPYSVYAISKEPDNKTGCHWLE